MADLHRQVTRKKIKGGGKAAFAQGSGASFRSQILIPALGTYSLTVVGNKAKAKVVGGCDCKYYLST
jgi:hypothetical protein